MAGETGSAARTHEPHGLGATFAAYGLWGLFPLYFNLLTKAGSAEIVAHRIAWTLVFCALGVTLTRGWGRVRTAWRDRRLVGHLALAGVLVSANWLLYVFAVLTGHVVDAALGYFFNPLVTVVLAVVVQRERLRPVQVGALGVGLAAVVVIGVGYGQFPWLGVGLAVTFGLYALVKSRVGQAVGPMVGIGFEAATTAPLAIAYIVVLELLGQGSFIGQGLGHTAALAGTGVVTAVPLLFFAYGAARLPLATVGLIQYITPMAQFSLGVWVFHESMPTARWIGFGLIWVALTLLSADMVRTFRRYRRR
jgi:chloramphenicol-sensitive protein RarD